MSHPTPTKKLRFAEIGSPLKSTLEKSWEWCTSDESNESGRPKVAHFLRILRFACSCVPWALEPALVSSASPFLCVPSSRTALSGTVLDESTAPETWLFELELLWDLSYAQASLCLLAHAKPLEAETSKGPEKAASSWLKSLASPFTLTCSCFTLDLVTPWWLICDFVYVKSKHMKIKSTNYPKPSYME